MQRNLVIAYACRCLSSFALGISFSSMLGNFLGWQGLSSWGGAVSMAVPTAVSLCCLASAILAMTFRRRLGE